MNNLREMHVYDLHFKSWELNVQDIEHYLSALNVDYTVMNDKFILKGIKYHKAIEVEKISILNGSILFIDNEVKAATVSFKFTKRIGFFNESILFTVKKFADTMVNQNVIDCYDINQDRIIVRKDDFEFKLSPSSTKERLIESTFFINVILLILKTEYTERFEVNFEPDVDVFKSIKYSNKIMDSKNRLVDHCLLIPKKA